jgi:hypothetical protein
MSAMRSIFHPPPASRRLTATEQASSDRSMAESLLGGAHPLVGVLRQSDVALHQLVSATAVQAAGVVWLTGNVSFGRSLAIAGLVVQVGLGCRVAALRARRRELCRELIVAGRQGLPLAYIDRERRRLLDPRTLGRLATSVDEIVEIAVRPLPRHPAVRPIFYVSVIRQVAPELRQIASLLRGSGPCAPGVATVEWLLTSPASPLYGVEVEPLRQELGRARCLLGLP